MLIILHFVILRVILNATLRCILFNICIGVKKNCNLLIWFIRRFSLHSTFHSECYLNSKSEGTELHTENRVAQKNPFANNDQTIESVSYVFWFGLFFPSFWEFYDSNEGVDNYMLSGNKKPWCQ